MADRIRVILAGGFLGAGKTTLLARAARHYRDQGLRVGLITNDQAAGLVDTGLLAAEGNPVAEVSAGCFCCRFSDFIAAADTLIEQAQPQILLCEPVGSCTDLAATVLRPLAAYHGDRFTLAPFTVVVDPARLRDFAALKARGLFPENVWYIFQKQLEEADIVLLNKADTLAQDERDACLSKLQEERPDVTVLPVSARTGAGLDAWLDLLSTDRPADHAMDVDYDVYADGEAALGWLNATVGLHREGGYDWMSFSKALLERFQQLCREAQAEIAHSKILLSVSDGTITGNITGSQADIMLSGQADVSQPEADLVFNARVCTSPERLRDLFGAALAETGKGLRMEVDQLDCFAPARPVPQHRLGV